MFAMASTHPSLDSLFRAMCQILGSELQHLGLLPKSLTPSEASQRAYALCPHHVSHYLGMDVHDTGLVSRGVRLEPGMVVTVEPGVYVDERNTDVPAEFRGIGMRVEDDVLVTEGGITVLTSQCPSSVRDVERACNG
jgi:Xaa-Pro aminopeptidase